MSHYPQARFLLSVSGLDQLARALPEEGREVAVAGRSNAGKSSAINAITERRALARSSKTPGRTQLLNFFELAQGQRLVDLPGYGYAKVSAEVQAGWGQLIGGYLETRECLVGLVLIVDSRRGLSEDDHGLLAWAQVRNLPVRILLSKSDKLNRAEGQKILQQTARDLPPCATAQLFSAQARLGVEEARDALENMLAPAAGNE